METGLNGKCTLVTGGAGGIGSAIVRAFAGEGARVCVHYRSSEERARSLAGEVAGTALYADMTNDEDVDRLVAGAVRDLGRLDILVANAGVWPPADEPIWTMPIERWRQTIRVNLEGTFLVCRAFLKHVSKTGHGVIVLIGSTAGIFGEAGHADYAAAKGALTSGFLKSLKNEIVKIAPKGRVNAVCPGWTVTEMTRDALEDPTLEPRVTRTMSMRKLGLAEDVARTVVALASDEVSGHVTGEVITVAGGMEGRLLHDD
jgi:3-oxoacyl-[acyl-carrier protein] reductase